MALDTRLRTPDTRHQTQDTRHRTPEKGNQTKDNIKIPPGKGQQTKDTNTDYSAQMTGSQAYM